MDATTHTSRTRSLTLWAGGAIVASAIAGQLVLMIGVGIGMLIVTGLGLGESVGVPVYWGSIIFVPLAYAAIIYGSVRLLGRHTAIPWIIWPAMLVYPTLWGIAAALSHDVVQPFPSVVAFCSIALAFVALGKHRWSAA